MTIGVPAGLMPPARRSKARLHDTQYTYYTTDNNRVTHKSFNYSWSYEVRKVTVSISENEIKLIEDATAWLRVGENSWNGILEATGESGIQSGKCYFLETDDGRSGIIRLGIFSMGKGCEFSGHGGLTINR